MWTLYIILDFPGSFKLAQRRTEVASPYQEFVSAFSMWAFLRTASNGSLFCCSACWRIRPGQCQASIPANEKEPLAGSPMTRHSLKTVSMCSHQVVTNNASALVGLYCLNPADGLSRLSRDCILCTILKILFLFGAIKIIDPSCREHKHKCIGIGSFCHQKGIVTQLIKGQSPFSGTFYTAR